MKILSKNIIIKNCIKANQIGKQGYFENTFKFGKMKVIRSLIPVFYEKDEDSIQIIKYFKYHYVVHNEKGKFLFEFNE